MCTSIGFKTKDFYFGRNMDLEYSFSERVVITPREYLLKFRKAYYIKRHYAIIGMATVVDNYPLYAEATNEKGLCMAGLNFPGNAKYPDTLEKDKINISPFEIIPWILSQCASVKEAKKLLDKTNLVAIPFSDDLPLATLHWHIADKDESIILECTKNGMQIHDNPANVLTNNPPFEFHITNLSQYINLETKNPKNCFTNDLGIKPFCKGSGSIGLPGDYSSASRFVKASYLILNSVCKDDENSSISQFFHILDSVSVVNGCITLEDEKEYMTIYSCCMNATKEIYYYKSYTNNQITAIKMNNENKTGNSLIEFPLVKEQQILWTN